LWHRLRTGMIVTNGMSEFARDKENANSALVVSVEPGDFGSSHPWPVLISEKVGKAGFCCGRFLQPGTGAEAWDFIEGRKSTFLGTVKPSYTGGTNLADIHSCLPTFVTDSIKKPYPILIPK